jgi:recombinational DNA repair ATPase RecF
LSGVTRKTPILLLDDVTRELDERRKEFLFSLLDEFQDRYSLRRRLPGDQAQGE